MVRKEYLFGVIADTHYSPNYDSVPWDEIKSHFKNVDMIFHAGDLITIEVIKRLGEIAPVEAVCGNMDSQEVCNCFPITKVLTFDDIKIGMCHGFGEARFLPEKLFPYFKDIPLNVLIFGHSHASFNRVINGVLCFNPGFPLKVYFNDHPSIGLLHIDKDGNIKGDIIPL